MWFSISHPKQHMSVSCLSTEKKILRSKQEMQQLSMYLKGAFAGNLNHTLHNQSSIYSLLGRSIPQSTVTLISLLTYSKFYTLHRSCHDRKICHIVSETFFPQCSPLAKQDAIDPPTIYKSRGLSCPRKRKHGRSCPKRTCILC